MKKLNFSYKWILVGISFLIIFTGLGFCSSPYGLYTFPITEALGISRSSYSLAETCRHIVTSVVNIFFGSLVFRFGHKKLILAGIISLIASVLIYSFATNVWVFYIGGCLLGLGFAFASTTMVSCIINKWFHKNKATILGFVLAANGLGGALSSQVLTPIIYNENNAFGYRNSFRLVAVILVILWFLVILFFKDMPTDCEIEEKTEQLEKTEKQKKKRDEEWVGIEFERLKTMPVFYITLICVFMSGFVLHAISGVSVVHMKDVNLPVSYIATVVSVNSLVLTCSKFITGILHDKKGIRFIVLMCTSSAIIATLSVALVTNSAVGMALAMVYGVLAAVALPLETIMLPIYVGDLFGQKSFDKVLGLIVSVNTAGYALSAPFVNGIYDLIGSYTPALICCSIVMLFILIAMMFVISKAAKMRVIIIAEYANAQKRFIQ